MAEIEITKASEVKVREIEWLWYPSFSDERLIQAVRQTGARLVVLDPLSAYIGEETGINAANEVRRQFRPLIEIARE